VRLLPALALLLLVLLPATAAQGATAADPLVIAARVREARHPWLRWPRFSYYQHELAGLYGPRANAALWLDGARPTAQAGAAIAVLADARAKGLDPLDYDAAMLGEMHRLLAGGAVASAQELALFDAALSISVVRLVSDLHIGRVEPRNVEFGLDVEPKPNEFATLLTDAVREGRVREAVDAAEPDFHPYQRMLNALHRYQALANDPSATPVVITRRLRPGDAFAGAAELARWLGALADLPPGVVPGEARYDAVLAGAVERFQRRHGL